MNIVYIKAVKSLFEQILEKVEKEMGDTRSLEGICETINLWDLSAIHELCNNMAEGIAVNEDRLSFVDKLYLEHIATQFETNSYHEIAMLGLDAGEYLRDEIFRREV
uniref:Uncharacterized protein n=1 Tax=Siphoviridae sp. ctn8e14 TaxID=2827936 RepID=A0A8S5T4A7_9CAUD|nr:MAG TPA: hypothetical protein [Siphoviridae sp. ctn8e14]